ncbi:transposase [Holospora curviuscula]|uniref:Insertion element IS402-like domain-containing protein n=1 Tax=Holospora curviuscula TaxID=1082868 RepID=A0A2S5R738_9PROT|nr:transposase [Holospora curviuscula]PPE03103.1 hypothetical protein HCUR_01453 [Holospora curviuscula]
MGQVGNRINRVFYIIKSGCPWRMLPKDFPPYSTVQSFYRSFRIKRIWKKVLVTLVKIIRIKAGESKNPSYRSIDSHGVKTTKACEQRRINGGKKNKGT